MFFQNFNNQLEFSCVNCYTFMIRVPSVPKNLTLGSHASRICSCIDSQYMLFSKQVQVIIASFIIWSCEVLLLRSNFKSCICCMVILVMVG